MRLRFAACVAFASLAAIPAGAVTFGPGAIVGVAVENRPTDGTSGTLVGNTLVNEPDLAAFNGGNAIAYFDPINPGGGTRVYGDGGTGDDGFGQTAAATPNNGPDELVMILQFAPIIAAPAPYEAAFAFQDLDLDGANTPGSFLEEVDIELFDSAGNSLFGKTTFSNDSQAGVTNLGLNTSGKGYLLTLGEFVVSGTTDPLFAELTFRAIWGGKGGNTREELVAWVQPVVTPLPAAALLFGSAFAVAGAVRRFGRKAA